MINTLGIDTLLSHYILFIFISNVGVCKDPIPTIRFHLNPPAIKETYVFML